MILAIMMEQRFFHALVAEVTKGWSSIVESNVMLLVGILKVLQKLLTQKSNYRAFLKIRLTI